MCEVACEKYNVNFKMDELVCQNIEDLIQVASEVLDQTN